MKKLLFIVVFIGIYASSSFAYTFERVINTWTSSGDKTTSQSYTVVPDQSAPANCLGTNVLYLSADAYASATAHPSTNTGYVPSCWVQFYVYDGKNKLLASPLVTATGTNVTNSFMITNYTPSYIKYVTVQTYAEHVWVPSGPANSTYAKVGAYTFLW